MVSSNSKFNFHLTPFKNYCMKNLQVREVNKFKKFKFSKLKELEEVKYSINENEIDN